MKKTVYTILLYMILLDMILLGSLSGGIAAQNLDYTAAMVKESFQVMARPNGAWVTSNAEYWTADSGEPHEYLMRFSLDGGGLVARGCMWGRSGQEETDPFWTFVHAWDPTRGAVLAYQVSPSGAVAVGHERPLEDGTQESIQELVFPGAEPQRVRHLNRHLHPDTLFSRSFDGQDGQWTPRRTYTWIWKPDVTSNPCVSESHDDSDVDPLGFLEPLMGRWVPASEWLVDNRGMENMVPLALDWGPSRKSAIDQSGLRTPSGRLFTFGTIIWNPTTQRAEFSASQSNDDLYFQGFYESVDANTVRRTYAVHYPDRTPVRFRETFFLRTEEAFDWYTEWEQGGAWVPRRGTGDPEFRAVRPTSSPVHALAGLDRFEGEWRRIPDSNRQSRPSPSSNDLLSFEWGTARQWMEFTEIVEENGERRVTNAGTFGYDPHDGSISYEGRTAGGVAVRGRIVSVDSVTTERHTRWYAPDGTIRLLVDAWRLPAAGENCFDWHREDQPTSRWCRS